MCPKTTCGFALSFCRVLHTHVSWYAFGGGLIVFMRKRPFLFGLPLGGFMVGSPMMIWQPLCGPLSCSLKTLWKPNSELALPMWYPAGENRPVFGPDVSRTTCSRDILSRFVCALACAQKQQLPSAFRPLCLIFVYASVFVGFKLGTRMHWV